MPIRVLCDTRRHASRVLSPLRRYQDSGRAQSLASRDWCIRHDADAPKSWTYASESRRHYVDGRLVCAKSLAGDSRPSLGCRHERLAQSLGCQHTSLDTRDWYASSRPSLGAIIPTRETRTHRKSSRQCLESVLVSIREIGTHPD